MTTSGRDLRYGRRGGNWLPEGYEPTPAPDDAPLCSVCGEPMMAGQPGHHWKCDPLADEPAQGTLL